jgi:hypothetical protein
MVFSANKLGIPRTNIQPQYQNQPNSEIQSPILQNTNGPNSTVNISTQILRLGMLSRIQNASDCSSCGK